MDFWSPTLTGVIIGTVLTTISTWLLFYSQKRKDRKNKLIELYGMMVESCSLLVDIIHYTECSYLVYAFHLRRFQLLTAMQVVASQEFWRMEIEECRKQIDFNMSELDKWRMMLITEKSKLQKYFYQMNGLVSIIDFKPQLEKILNYEFVNKFDFSSKASISELQKVDVDDLQIKGEKTLKAKLQPIIDSLLNPIKKKIY